MRVFWNMVVCKGHYLIAGSAILPRRNDRNALPPAKLLRMLMPYGAKSAIMDLIRQQQPAQPSPTATNANPLLPYWIV